MVEYSVGIVTAYGSAKRAGYTGTYEDFCRQQAQYAENASAVEQAKQTAVQSAQTAEQAKQDAQTASTTAVSASNTASTQAQLAGQSAQDAQTAESNAQTYAQSASASAGSAQQSAQTAQTVLESIPEDYSDLSSDVDQLKADLGDTKSAFAEQVGSDNVLFHKSSETVGAVGQTYQQKDVFEYTGQITEGEWYGFTSDSITGATNSSPMRIKLLNGSTVIRYISNGSFAKIEIYDTDITAGVDKVVSFIYASTSTAQTAPCVATNPIMTKGASANDLVPHFTYSEDFEDATGDIVSEVVSGALFGGTISKTSTYASCDELPVGKTFGITNAASLTNKPASEGLITTLSRYANEATIRYQLFFASSGAMYTRVLWGTWKNWKQMSTSADYAAVIAKLGALQDIALGSYEAEFVNSTTGKFVAAANYSRTGFIPIKGVKIAVGVATTASNVGIAFYDNAKKYISGTDFSGHSVGDTVELSVPAYTDYFVYCGLSANSAHMHVVNIQLANAVSLNDQNPCFWDKSNECRTFKKILCIGDSLTAGQFDYKENGITKEFNDEDYAYPAYLKAITGRDTTNAGDAGETTVTWYALHGSEDFSGHDACIIHLGRNDYAGQNSVSTEDRITAMNNIIAKVKSDNPQIKIFISTQINYYQYTNVGIINADMATVVANNADCYLLDIYTYGRMKLSDDAYSHCTAVGYQTLAEYYYKYISWIMHMQYAEFKTVQFTGTNRAY